MFYFYFVAGRSKPAETLTVPSLRADVLKTPQQSGMFIRIDFGKHVDGTTRKPISIGYSSNDVHRAAFRADANRHSDGKQPNLKHHHVPIPRATDIQIASSPRRRPPQTNHPLPRTVSAGPPDQSGIAVGSRIRETSAYTSTTAEHQNYRTRLSQAHFVSPKNVTATHPPPPAIPPPRQATAQQSAAQLHIARKPLPASPSAFRLGESDLPWQTSMDFPSWIAEDYEEPHIHYSNSPTSLYANPSPLLSPLSRSASSPVQSLSCQSEPTSPVVNLADDPRRTRELVSLSQAMMTVDSFTDDRQRSVNEMESEAAQRVAQRRPKSIGWAVRVEPQNLMPDSGAAEDSSAHALPLPQCYQGTWPGQHVEYQAQDLRRTRSSH